VVTTLFPPDGEEGPPGSQTDAEPPRDRTRGDEAPGVTEEELAVAVRRMGVKNTAPGPDGIPGRVWILAMSVLGDRLRHLFDECLRQERFNRIWKTGRLVLIAKPGRPAESPSAYRSICLLDEAGKLFERIIAARLQEHLSQVGPDLAKNQFGFRKGRSTMDAIRRVRAFAEEATSRGGVAITVSPDIFNSTSCRGSVLRRLSADTKCRGT